MLAMIVMHILFHFYVTMRSFLCLCALQLDDELKNWPPLSRADYVQSHKAFKQNTRRIGYPTKICAHHQKYFEGLFTNKWLNLRQVILHIPLYTCPTTHNKRTKANAHYHILNRLLPDSPLPTHGKLVHIARHTQVKEYMVNTICSQSLYILSLIPINKPYSWVQIVFAF